MDQHGGDQWIPAHCPDCDEGYALTLADIGQDITCRNCGTVFFVAREKRWRRRPGHYRSDDVLITPEAVEDIDADRTAALSGFLLTLLVAALFLAFLIADHRVEEKRKREKLNRDRPSPMLDEHR